MDDKTQASKKTVVAFVAGLLIGGFLVWLFSGTPNTPAPSKTTNRIDTGTTQKGSDTGMDKTETTNTETSASKTESVASDFTFSVINQSAGMNVSLGDNVSYPSAQGWIAVHEDVDGKPGSAIGAARYETTVGLKPTQVELMRKTVAGKTYRVIFYNESGDHVFDRKTDTPMTNKSGGLVETTFVAQ